MGGKRAAASRPATRADTRQSRRATDPRQTKVTLGFAGGEGPGPQVTLHIRAAGVPSPEVTFGIIEAQIRWAPIHRFSGTAVRGGNFLCTRPASAGARPDIGHPPVSAGEINKHTRITRVPSFRETFNKSPPRARRLRTPPGEAFHPAAGVKPHFLHITVGPPAPPLLGVAVPHWSECDGCEFCRGA